MELIKLRYEDIKKFKQLPYKFVIYPYQDVNEKNKINKFSIDKAIFKVKKNKYNNENRYILRPIQ